MDGNDMSVEDDQKENESSENSSPLVNSQTPLSFPELTTSQLGICAQSFSPSATPKGQRFCMPLLWRLWPVWTLPCFTHNKLKQQVWVAKSEGILVLGSLNGERILDSKAIYWYNPIMLYYSSPVIYWYWLTSARISPYREKYTLFIVN